MRCCRCQHSIEADARALTRVGFTQVHIYLPDAGHPAHGLVRVIVKDSNDNFTGPTSRTWLDSGDHPPPRVCKGRDEIHGSVGLLTSWQLQAPC